MSIYLDVAFCIALAVLAAYALKCLFTCFRDTVRENVVITDEAVESNNEAEIEVRDLENNEDATIQETNARRL